MLTEVGSRLQSVLRPNQMLARLGGDEFAVVLPGAGQAPAARVAQVLLGSLDEPFQIGGSRLHVRASVGLATCVLPSEEPGDLLRQADVAMYRAKESGSGVEVYEPSLDPHSADRLKRIDELRSALLRGDLEVHLQPQVALAFGRGGRRRGAGPLAAPAGRGAAAGAVPAAGGSDRAARAGRGAGPGPGAGRLRRLVAAGQRCR